MGYLPRRILVDPVNWRGASFQIQYPVARKIYSWWRDAFESNETILF